MRGRPPYVPTEDQRQLVMVLRSDGVDVAVIASILRIAKSTPAKTARQLRDGLGTDRRRVGAGCAGRRRRSHALLAEHARCSGVSPRGRRCRRMATNGRDQPEADGDGPDPDA